MLARIPIGPLRRARRDRRARDLPRLGRLRDGHRARAGRRRRVHGPMTALPAARHDAAADAPDDGADPRCSRSACRSCSWPRKLPGFVHIYVGEEAVAAGVCAALRRDDYITSTHRGHGHAIAKGVGLDRLMAELYGQGDRRHAAAAAARCTSPTSRSACSAPTGSSAAGFGIAAGAALSAALPRLRPGRRVLLRRRRRQQGDASTRR